MDAYLQLRRSCLENFKHSNYHFTYPMSGNGLGVYQASGEPVWHGGVPGDNAGRRQADGRSAANGKCGGVKLSWLHRKNRPEVLSGRRGAGG